MMARVIIVLLGFTLEVALSFRSTVRISKGDVAVLHCENTPGNTNIRWIRSNPSDIVPATTYTVGWRVSGALPINKRVKILGSENNPNYNLQISNTIKDDTGVYRCISINGNKPVEYMVELFVEDELTTSMYEVNNTSTTQLYFRGTMQDSGFMLSTLYLIPSAVGGCLVCLVIATLFILVKRKRRSVDIPSTTVRRDDIDILQSGESEEHETEHVYDSLSENRNIISFSGVPYHVSDVHRQHGLSEASGGDNQPSGTENTCDTTHGYYSNPYEPLMDNWANYTPVYEGGNSKDSFSQSEMNKNCQHLYDVCEDVHT